MAGPPGEPSQLEALRRDLEARRRLLDERLAHVAASLGRVYGSPRAPAALVGVRTRAGRILRRQPLADASQLELVGVRTRDGRLRFAPGPEIPLPTPAPAPARAVVVEAPPPEEEAPAVLDPETVTLAQAPSVPEAWRVADATIEQIDQALRLVEEELARLAQKERLLTDFGSRAAGRPYRVAEYTLYASARPTRDGLRVDYRFRSTPTRDAIPVPLPKGYRVRRHPRTNVPYVTPET